MGCDLSPLQVLAEFPELPYVPFGGDGKRRNVPTAKLRDKLNLGTYNNLCIYDSFPFVIYYRSVPLLFNAGSWGGASTPWSMSNRSAHR